MNIIFFIVSFHLFLCTIALKPVNYSTVSSEQCNYTPLEFGKNSSGIIDSTKDEIFFCRYSFMETQTWAVRIWVSSNASQWEYPLLTVVKQETDIVSWQVPLILKKEDKRFIYNEVSYTLCPPQNAPNSSDVETKKRTVYVLLSSSSTVLYNLKMSKLNDFLISTESGRKGITVEITPSQPAVFEYKFPEGHHKVFVRATSEDSQCMILSVQKVKCPIHYQQNDVTTDGLYQTMRFKGGISVDREYYPTKRFYIVLSMKSSSTDCGQLKEVMNATSGSHKRVFLHVLPRGKSKDLLTPILVTVAVYFGSCLLVYLFFPPQPRAWSRLPLLPWQRGAPSPAGNSASTDASNNPTEVNREPQPSRCRLLQNCLRNILRMNRPQDETGTGGTGTENRKCVEQFFQNGPNFPKGYTWNVFTIAVFYGLPVAQLVFMNQMVMFNTGNQDMCYFNYQCSFQVSIFYDFNHIFSNIGYIILGLFFLLIVLERSAGVRKHNAENCGVPHNYDIFYSMGVALIMEGVLSSCYHLCPNRSNFQFDTAFMYIITGLCILKIFQARHCDIAAKSYEICAFFAGVIIIGLLGLQTGASLTFWILYGLVHISTVVVFTARVYHEVQCILSIDIWCKFLSCSEWSNFCQSIKGCKGANIWLILVNLGNFGWIIYGIAKQKDDFASFLLNTFIANLLVYLLYYIFMKAKVERDYKCHVNVWISLGIVMVLCVVVWSFALYFFNKRNTSWSQSPAISRMNNKDCILGGFYDDHDVWHFLSSWALFFSFLVLLILDDDVQCVPHSKLPVF